jgi:hypothetical protein
VVALGRHGVMLVLDFERRYVDCKVWLVGE